MLVSHAIHVLEASWCILHIILIFAHLWWFGGWALELGFWGWGFQSSKWQHISIKQYMLIPVRRLLQLQGKKRYAANYLPPKLPVFISKIHILASGQLFVTSTYLSL